MVPKKMDAIHTFAREGELDNLLKCIESGVSMHLQDSKGRTPIHWAVDRGHLKITEALLSRNADANAKKTCAASHAISAWECGGYLLFKNRYQFDQVTEDAMVDRLSSFSLDDNNFEAVKQLCCSIASKFDV